MQLPDRIIAGFLAFALAFFPALAGAQSPVRAFPPGTFQSRAPLDAATGGGGYVGPLDVVSGAKVAYSMDCASTTYVGNAFDLVDAATGNTTGSRIQCAVGGVQSALVSGSACTFVTGNACSPIATTCAVACVASMKYDQSGAVACAGGTLPCDMPQSINADRLTYVQNCFGGTKQCLQSATYATKGFSIASGFPTIAQPYTLSAVAIRAGTTGSQGDVMDQGGHIQFCFWTTSGQFLEYASGSVVPVSGVTESAWHAFQGVFQGATSSLRVDATANTGLNIGTDSINTGDFQIGGINHGLQGSIFEEIIWARALTPTEQTAICNNQKSRGVPITSC